jgi:cell division protein FtsN
MLKRPKGDEQELKQRGTRRLALALALIVATIIGLALLDRYAGQKRAPLPRPPTEPPAIAALREPKTVPVPETPREAPTAQKNPTLPPPPPTVGEESAAPLARVPAKPSTGAAEIREGTEGVAPGARKPPTGEPTGAAKPAAQAAQPVPESRQGFFVVQLGVFTAVENAQALQARLKVAGIPAFLETRVVVGPFRDRAESEAARRKLGELGVGGVIVQRR